MTTRQLHVRTATVLSAGALMVSACSGSSQVSEPADIDRPDVEVDVYSGAACDAIPQDVIDRHAPEVERYSLDAEDLPDDQRPKISSCAWADDEPTLHLYSRRRDVRAGTEILVSLYGFDDQQRASDEYDLRYNLMVRPEGAGLNATAYGQVHEITIGDQGFMQHRRIEDGSAATAYFTAGDALVEIMIVRGALDPWTDDEAIAAMSEIIASFGS